MPLHDALFDCLYGLRGVKINHGLKRIPGQSLGQMEDPTRKKQDHHLLSILYVDTRLKYSSNLG